MISNVVVEIDGRRALPLRALPFVCAWAVAPDSLVRALCEPPLIEISGRIQVGGVIQRTAGCTKIQNRRSLCAYMYFLDGTWHPLSPEQWEHVELALCNLTQKLEIDEREGAEGENHARWRVEATLMLPDDAFVWVDEFVRWFEENRPLAVPTEGDVALWRIEQERLYEGEDLAMVLDEGMSEFKRVGRIDFVVVLPVELIGKIWRCNTATPTAPLVVAPAQTRVVRGRPRTISKKASILSAILDRFANIGTWDDRIALPGTCSDLLDACQRIEKNVTNNTTTFSELSEDRFRDVLALAGFKFRPGRRPKGETRIWTRDASRIVGEIDARDFLTD